MEHLLFGGYLIFFTWLVTKIRFFSRSGLTAAQLVSVFLLKVMMGIFYGWMGVYFGNTIKTVDTWLFQQNSLNETRLLLAHPVTFVLDLFHTGYSNGYGGFLGEQNSWWNDLDINVMLKLLGIFNVASFGHYYINVIFYSFLTLFGPIALFRIFQDYYPGRHPAVFLAVFFIPSFIYWTSGLHKEGLLFNSIALISYAVYFSWKEHRLTWKRSLSILISIALLLALRNYIALLLLAALLAWAVARKLAWNAFAVYAGIYFFFAALFFAAPLVSPKLNFPNAIAGKQEQFLKKKGNSEVLMQPLQPSVSSFLKNAPQAVNISILRPNFFDIRNVLSLATAVEINGLLLLSVLALIWNRRRFRFDPFLLFCVFFSFSVLLIIGYTVPFLGAVVRYRSVVLPLLFAPFIIQLPWEHFTQFLLNISNKNNFKKSS